jgi:hypothetical protein
MKTWKNANDSTLHGHPVPQWAADVAEKPELSPGLVAACTCGKATYKRRKVLTQEHPITCPVGTMAIRPDHQALPWGYCTPAELVEWALAKMAPKDARRLLKDLQAKHR